ncbi:Regulator of nonsense transcripts 1 [Neolecta irregularis DAH-3]|uniref:Regulator of nonsense transcripts 1 n=1 Tax=Neolecta irregularis (strain DAH-3) TaxID=1198029 RepID=A0A1U7LVS6_NEOID|nr:Regulator of nonsense transcripts 1 [Neolecta irregularis DAH-3]|eukprot:OLL26786.1 Regulator of nonsense transcripts 1 [Neolecta irregularis DAH-3]
MLLPLPSIPGFEVYKVLDVHEVMESSLHEDDLNWILHRDISAQALVGFAASYNREAEIINLTFSTESRCLAVTLDQDDSANSLLSQRLLNNRHVLKTGYGIWEDAIAMLECGYHIMSAFEFSCHVRKQYKARDPALDISLKQLFKVALSKTEKAMFAKHDSIPILDAWRTFICTTKVIKKESIKCTFNIDDVPEQDLKLLRDFVYIFRRIKATGKTSYEADFISSGVTENGLLIVENARYSSRARYGAIVRVETESGESVIGQVVNQERKTSYILPCPKGRLQAVKVFSDNSLTPDEICTLFRNVVLKSENLSESSFIRHLFFGGTDGSSTDSSSLPSLRNLSLKEPQLPKRLDRSQTKATRLIVGPPSLRNLSEPQLPKRLNRSQTEAARLIVRNEQDVTFVHGPPGTGKTTVIVAAATAWSAKNPKGLIYIVAQSNTAVKNIAEAFLKYSQTDFRIVVSNEFYEGWHEDLFLNVKDKVITTKKLKPGKNIQDFNTKNGPRILLCTISMASSRKLEKVSSIFAPDLIIVDEASQIYTGQFVVMLYQFQKSLNQIVFFGDPMQLSPYGSDIIDGIKSVFDIPKFMDTEVLLDVQYRMPVPLGDFISQYVYDSKLISVHPRKSIESCLRFVHVSGCEEKLGTSRKNIAEAIVVADIVEKYYKSSNFAVIAGYDAQRSTIALELKARGIPEHFAYNIDTYQGHENDVIIVSVTRTMSPGFMNHIQRLNVMLTRAKKVLIVVGNESFLSSEKMQATLLGKYMNHFDYEDGFVINGDEIYEGSARFPVA